MEEEGFGHQFAHFFDINNAVVFTKSGVNKGWAIFWFLMGIILGIIYVKIAQNRPKTLYCNFAPLAHGYSMVHFAGTNMDHSERVSLARAVQRRFMVSLLPYMFSL